MPQSMQEQLRRAGWSHMAERTRPEAQQSVQRPLPPTATASSLPIPSTQGGLVNPLKQTFSEQERQKMDQDLYLLSQLSQALRSAHRSLLVVDFGYAVDALCAGALTRYHHDMDVRLILPLDAIQQEVLRSALRILNEPSDCSWKLHLDEANPSWVAFCVGDPHDLLAPRCDVHLLRSEKPLSRAEEIEVLSREGHRYRLPLQKAWLQDSAGKSYELVVPTAEALATTKWQLLYAMGQKHLREWSPTDSFDLRRLLSLASFEHEQVRANLLSYFTKVHGMDEAKAWQHIEALHEALTTQEAAEEMAAPRSLPSRL